MRQNLKRFLAIAAFIMGASLALNAAIAYNDDLQPTEPAFSEESLDEDKITIKTKDGADLVFHIELATTSDEQAKGLMYRTFMAEDAGMLFLFPGEDMRTFWMKNTYIPLDMIFIAKDGEIQHIHSNAKPQSLTKITSLKPAQAVLEINGGMADKLGIKEGDKVLHPAFNNILPQ